MADFSMAYPLELHEIVLSKIIWYTITIKFVSQQLKFEINSQLL